MAMSRQESQRDKQMLSLTYFKKMKIKTTLRYHFFPFRLTHLKKKNEMLVRLLGWELLPCIRASGTEIRTVPLEDNLAMPIKTSPVYSSDAATPSL